MMLTGAQVRAARAIARWTPNELAGRARVSVEAISHAEQGDGLARITMMEQHAIVSVLKAVGIEFTGTGGPGVRLKMPDVIDEGIRPQDLTSENYG